MAWPAHLLRAEATIVRRAHWLPQMDLVVDLGERIGSPRWWRGAATLTAMVAALVWVAPRLRPSPIADRVVAARPVRFVERASPPTSASVTRPIAIGGVPVRRVGIVTGGLYHSLRAVGASPAVAADVLSAMATRIDVGTIMPGDRFDIVVDAAGGGRLLYAGLLHDGQPLSLMRWMLGGREQWLDAAGTGAPGDGFIVPVADARLSSGFGMRFHPILGFSRMHQGVDLAAPAGTPIVAAAEGIVRFAGAHGGYGNFVQVEHNGGMGSGYGHMSTIVVRPGQMVRQGDLLGTVGSTGLSTGPHCHFEIYRGGVAIDPTTANYAVAAQLGGEPLRQFRAALAKIVALPADA